MIQIAHYQVSTQIHTFKRWCSAMSDKESEESETLSPSQTTLTQYALTQVVSNSRGSASKVQRPQKLTGAQKALRDANSPGEVLWSFRRLVRGNSRMRCEQKKRHCEDGSGKESDVPPTEAS